MFTYDHSVSLVGRTLEQFSNPTQTLIDASNDSIYICIKIATRRYVYLDIGKVVTQSVVDPTTTITDFIPTLTDFLIERYKSDLIPMMDGSGTFINRITSEDALRSSDLDIDFTSIKTPGVRSDLHRVSLLDDLVISPTTKRDLSSCLVSVNGVFHPTTTFKNEVYVKDGFYNIKNSKGTDVSLFDTSSVGGHTLIPITPSMVRNTDDQDLTRSVYLQIPDQYTFQDKTVMVVLNGYLYALDDSYQVLSDRVLKLRSNVIDYIHDYLHNPNTTYLHDASLRLLKSPYGELPPTGSNPPVANRIDHFLRHMYPYKTRNGHKTAMSDYSITVNDYMHLPPEQQLFSPEQDFGPFASELMLKDWLKHWVPTKLTLRDKIEHYLTTEYKKLRKDRKSAIQSFNWPAYYKYFAGIYPTIPMSFLKSADFFKKVLFSPHSFLIVLNTPVLYQRTYKLHKLLSDKQHHVFSDDMPRGFLRYNQRKILPYVIMSNDDADHHITQISYTHTSQDIYKQSYNPVAVPTPMFDLKDTHTDHSLELLEYFR